MDVNLGKAGFSTGGRYNPDTVYPKLTVVTGVDNNGYISRVNGTRGISPGITDGWENYWVQISTAGAGVVSVELVEKIGKASTYAITLSNGYVFQYVVMDGNDGMTTSVNRVEQIDGNVEIDADDMFLDKNDPDSPTMKAKLLGLGVEVYVPEETTDTIAFRINNENRAFTQSEIDEIFANW